MYMSMLKVTLVNIIRMYSSRASFSISPILRNLQPVKDQDIGFPKLYNLPYQYRQFIKKNILKKIEHAAIMVIYSNIQC